MRIGVALGSGSARGWSHIGVLHGLEECGVKPAVVVGASVGTLVGAAYASGQLATLEGWVRKLTRVDVWRLLDTTFRGGGVITGNRLMRAIGEQLEDRSIEGLPIAFAAVAADLDTGQEVWLREGPMLSAVRASSGMPGLFAPMWYQNRWLIDGGVVNPVPVSLCRAQGADYVIAVNLNRHLNRYAMRKHQRADPGTANPAARSPKSDELPGWPGLDRLAGLVDGLVEALKPAKNGEPRLFDVMATSIDIMQDRITRSRMVGDPPDLVLSPDLTQFHLMDFHRADEAISIGRREVARVEAELRALHKLSG